jgi:acetoin utilization deacetylase AcuC-like enzyme
VLYQAGADPYREDPYSPLDLDHDDLRERDRWCSRGRGREDSDRVGARGRLHDGRAKVVAVHVGTFDAAQSVYGESVPRERG